MIEFKLTEEYIQLNNLLKALSLVGSGGEAKLLIKEGLVLVNGEVEFQVRKKLRAGDKIQFDEAMIQVIE